MPNMIVLRLPIPPSVNGMYNNRRQAGRRGRVKTDKYKSWLREADAWYYLQKLHKVEPITGKCEVEIRLPKIRGDVSNRIKAAEDYLVSRKLTGDDKNNRKVSVEVDEGLTTQECWITVRAA